MEYQVPQFIEVEDKIFGPLTWKQFIYLGGGIGLTVIAFLYFKFFIAFLVGALIMTFSGALAFYKVNDRTFVDFLGAAFGFYTKSQLYLWRKEEKTAQPQAAPVALPTPEKLGLTGSRLHDLALSLDIQDQNNVPEE